jgi:hypothetical protein
MKREIKNKTASIRAKLANISKAQGTFFSVLITITSFSSIYISPSLSTLNYL